MQKNRLGIFALISLCFKQLFNRLAVWLKLNLWFILLCIPILTIPAAKAALYHTVKEELRDPFETHLNPREEFRKAFFALLGRSFMLSLVNLLVLAIIIAAFIFWMGIEPRILKVVTILVIYFAVMWWVCQPFLFPVLVENPEIPLQEVIKKVIRLAFSQPFYALFVTFITTLLSLLGIILLGPVLLVIPTLNALITTQAYWSLTGAEIPDLIDPVVYANRQDKLRPR
jgi:uncharacterized membrane protein YesL